MSWYGEEFQTEVTCFPGTPMSLIDLIMDLQEHFVCGYTMILYDVYKIALNSNISAHHILLYRLFHHPLLVVSQLSERAIIICCTYIMI